MAKRSIATEYQLRRSFQAFPPKRAALIRKRDKENRTTLALATILALLVAIGPMVAAYLAR
jgi:hypothetical protein